jgi:hypothetical protein
MKWETCWNWYKKTDGTFARLKTKAVKANASLVGKDWIKVETCKVTGGYIDAEVSKKEEPAKKS